MSTIALMPARTDADTDRQHDRWLSLAKAPAPEISQDHAERILRRGKPSPMRPVSGAAAIAF